MLDELPLYGAFFPSALLRSWWRN